jgi:2'-5' RNA ligase
MRAIPDRLRGLLRPPATAIVVPVAAARRVVASYTGTDQPAEPGMPPHITVMWPFRRRVSRSDVDALREIAARYPPFEFTLSSIRRFPGVTYLRPEPAEPFVDLTRAVWQRWPSFPPYGGAYDEIVPHLTLAFEESADEIASSAVESLLPITARADTLELLAPMTADAWQLLHSLPLGSNDR